jgi:acetolactate synthase-1/2/3 large subunit
VTTRHEGAASFMAEAWGKLTGAPGVCLVTRGPGATNASIGVHTAAQNSSPMVLLVGQVPTEHRGREAFQEIDYHAFFGSVAKQVVEIDDVDRAGALLADAFAAAISGRPGPVVVSLPEDMLTARSASPPGRPRPARPSAPSPADIEAIEELLATAERPLFLVGGGGWTDAARADLVAVAEANDIPVVTAFRFHDLCDNTSVAYAGEAGVAMPAAVRETVGGADLIVALGVRFGEMTTDAWSVLDVPHASPTIVHVHPSRAELGRIYHADLAIEAAVGPTLAGLRGLTLQPAAPRSRWRDDRRAAFIATLECPPQPGGLDMGEVMAWLRDELPADVIITNGAGNFTVWPNKFMLYGPHARLLGPQSGAMGYGLPAALAAKAADPDRMAVCFAGDGDLQMVVGELGTAAQHGLQPIVLVIDNAMYGTIRMHQERRHPGRVIGTDIVNPDFVLLGTAYGFHSERVTTTAAFPDAFRRAAASPTGALLHLVVDPQMLTPQLSVEQARG